LTFVSSEAGTPLGLKRLNFGQWSGQIWRFIFGLILLQGKYSNVCRCDIL